MIHALSKLSVANTLIMVIGTKAQLINSYADIRNIVITRQKRKGTVTTSPNPLLLWEVWILLRMFFSLGRKLRAFILELSFFMVMIAASVISNIVIGSLLIILIEDQFHGRALALTGALASLLNTSICGHWRIWCRFISCSLFVLVRRILVDCVGALPFIDMIFVRLRICL